MVNLLKSLDSPPPPRRGCNEVKTFPRLVLGALATALLVLSFLGVAGTAQADGICRYLGGTTDNGPCLEFRNQISWKNAGSPMHVWCFLGPTPGNQKIVLRREDSFTCKGRSDGRSVVYVQRTQAGCEICSYASTCARKTVVTLHGQNGDTLRVTCE